MDSFLADEIRKTLHDIIKNPECELNFNDNYQLLIAVTLSAQTTDKKVNSVSNILFDKYPDFYTLALADKADVKQIIDPLGLSETKSKNIIEIAKRIVNEYEGKTPSDYQSLTSLKGIGRKTANVVMALGFNIPAFPVDTHVLRVAYRLKFTDSNTDVIKAEVNLKKFIKEEYWIESHHLFLLFGRYHCKAIHPKCDDCLLKKYCILFN